MKNLVAHSLIVLIIISSYSCEDKSIVKKEKTDNDYKLVWSDEFNIDGAPNEDKWSFDYGDGCPNCGWGNKEKQFYTKNSKNVRVKDGQLIIETHKEEIESYNYSSGRIVTKEKGDWKYGKFEIRAILPEGRGTWPAIWMLPTDWEYGGWPSSGEIDIMEHVGHDADSVYGTIHTKAYNHSIGTEVGNSIYVENTSEFHTYSIEWTAASIKWFVDNKKYFEVENEGKTFAEYPFDKKFHLILNTAIGGFWGGEKGIDDTIFPQQFIIDYVRVYQIENK